MFVLESRMLSWRRGKKGGGEEKYKHRSKLVVYQHTFIHHKHMESITSFLWTESARERKKKSGKRSMSINQNLLSTNTLSFITNIRNQSQASLGPTLWSSSSISFHQQLYQAITAVSSSSSSSSWTSFMNKGTQQTRSSSSSSPWISFLIVWSKYHPPLVLHP